MIKRFTAEPRHCIGHILDFDWVQQFIHIEVLCSGSNMIQVIQIAQNWVTVFSSTTRRFDNMLGQYGTAEIVPQPVPAIGNKISDC